MAASTTDSYRDIESPDPPDRASERPGRDVVAVIGIDRYAAWPELGNAVSDARGAFALFTRLGFEPAAAPLLDQAATAEALRRLVTDDLARLGPEDSLVLFFAGHGFTRTHHLSNAVVKTGYIIPVDGHAPEGSAASWVRLDSWLSDVARLPAKHILVILDACYSGVALDAVVTWRGLAGDPSAEPLAQLRARQSRRVITSALENERALDSGPVPGHSLFTGCLIEALTGGLARDGKREATGSELGQYVQRRVTTYPGSRQTPDFGALELDDRGEIVLPLVVDPRPAVPPAPGRPGRLRRAVVGGTAGLALVLMLAWRVASGYGEHAVPPDGPHAPADGALAPADGPPHDARHRQPLDAALAPDDGPPPDAWAHASFADASAPADASVPVDASASIRPRKPRCWLPHDDVHAAPRPCRGRRCPERCIDARSDDAPVRVPVSAFVTCAEVWICE